MLEVWLEPDQFVIRREGREGDRRAQEESSVVSRCEPSALPLEEWHAQLCDALAKHANAKRARAAWILKQIGGGA